MNLNELQELADAAKRIVDTVSLHFAAASDILDPAGKWCAFSLEDGTSDGHLYDSKVDAMRHQPRNPKLYCYMKLTPDGINIRDATRFLVINRNPAIDTTSPEHIINPRIYKRFSNLSSSQKQTLINQARRYRPNG